MGGLCIPRNAKFILVLFPAMPSTFGFLIIGFNLLTRQVKSPMHQKSINSMFRFESLKDERVSPPGSVLYKFIMALYTS